MFRASSRVVHSTCDALGVKDLRGHHLEPLINLTLASRPSLINIQSNGGSTITDTFTVKQDGWILGPQSELLLWVPPTLRKGLYGPRSTLVIGRCVKTPINFEYFVHGDEWTRCGESIG
ncbi:hypothetical protein M408DRAFT_29334 [Serendipita vermifera MAFF 305830]|uniref:Uncharacterized protein n=1 Tax=Serendipita vermifera MAFF 305830 TaxID=933852 RepID=A0A0C3AAP1_SERVB|nr:hypothetical protein M408DRAFT_29334 [Serendipita vermifera MAFF 305830]